jgi:prepilin-type N-terminal cleavage/methylation domain-containing protein
MTRRGMTLVEMMVATTMSLIILGIIAQLFGMLGKGISGSRSALSLSEQLRAVGNTLRTDLSGLTVQTIPPASPDSDCGYLEIIEGNATTTLSPGSTDDPGAATRATTLTGDCDDILLLTTRSFDSPFVGRFESGQIESQYAEVAWFCRESPAAFQTVAGSTLYTLYRRQLLVMGYVGAGNFFTTNSIAGTIPAAYDTYDLSLRNNGSNRLFPNSLGDLTKRENRFLHHPSGIIASGSYPYANLSSPPPATACLGGNRTGEDIVLTNMLAFDVRVFDADAPVQNMGSVAVTPGDPGYSTGATTTGRGAYVDLGFNGGSPVGIAATFPPANSTALMAAGVRVTGTGGTLANKALGRVYDTGSLHYEFNGVDEDGDGIIDQGTNGVDDNGDGVIDDANERETSPPYPVPLRGLEVRIRCYEPQSRQVRQITVRHTFVPH